MKRYGLILWLLPISPVFAQHNGDFSVVRAEVDFSRVLREWDGFGFNYVQVPQAVNDAADRQEYGGLRLLSERQRREIIELMFGDENKRRYAEFGVLTLDDRDLLLYTAPARSAASFFAK